MLGRKNIVIIEYMNKFILNKMNQKYIFHIFKTNIHNFTENMVHNLVRKIVNIIIFIQYH
jgi:hypothetical protein